MPGFDLKQLLPLYDEIGRLKYGGTLNFPQLMKLMEPVRLGQEDFGLKHLEIIKRDHLFPAWWKMPELSPQEIDSLKELFKNIQPKDIGLIQKLFDIFKNIEIMSCLLRIICPEHYGIYSAPVENLLSIKAETPVKKYLCYLDDLSELKESYGFDTSAEVDMSLWALSAILNEDWLRNNPDYHQIYLDYINEPNAVKRISARQALKNIRRENVTYLDLAECFLATDPEVAGFLAGKELESLIYTLYEKVIPRRKGYRAKDFRSRVEELWGKRHLRDQEKEEIFGWWETRNKAVHPDWVSAPPEEVSLFREEVIRMISGVRGFKEKLSKS
ncbi:MAG TPA: hypothetical protein P5517_06205 [Candidatus Saccharicenans sp.]|nr:hypothetical protein [Candidatus Saccharicenans sp.]HOT69348.1 hypothetical protein [Candidatus Saccharicenans sp.]HPC88346.1 hypothetical protein [Candidatus Saccharicenans sp.]HQE64173.1 hypothetical protein [Candidatus Saccharicenans sp.]HQH61339.1 hypothetical protein [Candidatus Saccharicenans sp.]